MVKTCARKKRIVIIDTNFAMLATKYRIDLREGFLSLFGTFYELAILPQVVDELRHLNQRVPLKILGLDTGDNDTAAIAAGKGHSLNEKVGFRKSNAADDAIIERVREENQAGQIPAVCTMDYALKKRLKDVGLTFLNVVIRQKARLSVV